MIQDYIKSSRSINVASTTCEDSNGLDHVDYRLIENRREGFLQWWAACTEIGDVDCPIWGINYLNKRYEYNQEEKYFFAWLYHVYNLPTAFILKNECPDQELASVDRFEQWTNENYSRIYYDTDTKWSKGHIAAMYASYHEFVGLGTQHERFTELCQDSPQENFDRLWEIVIKTWWKMGRYSAWFVLQTYKHTCDLPIEPSSLFLNNYEGSKSHRNGLCYAAGKDDWINQRLTAEEYMWLEGFAQDLIVEARARWPRFSEQFDAFSLETCGCSFKKLFRVKRGRYCGFYLDRMSEQIAKAEKSGWYGIDWNVLHQMRHECVGDKWAPRGAKIDNNKMSLFLNTGGYHHYAKEG
jgi:hypothetical protein